MAGKPAVRVGDSTAHGGTVVGPGAPTVLIGGKPAAVMGDMTVCPLVNPGTPPPPHVGGPIMATGMMVLIAGKPAARMGDTATCAGPPDSLIMGEMMVLIGDGGGGGGAGAGSSSKTSVSDKVAEAETRETGKLTVSFVDKAGKKVTGVAFKVADSANDIESAVKKQEAGKLKRSGKLTGDIEESGLEKGAQMSVGIQAITSAVWSKTKVKAKETVKIASKVAGIADDSPAAITVFVRDGNFADKALTMMEAKVNNGEIECEWIPEVNRDMLKIQEDKENSTFFSAPLYFFKVECAGHALKSGMLQIVDDFEVTIVDDQGNAIANRPYQVILPSGEVREGTLDSSGKATIKDVPPGRVKFKVMARE